MPRSRPQHDLGLATLLHARARARPAPACRRDALGDRRRAHGEAVAAALEDVIGDVAGLLVGACRPFRAEPDLRAFLATDVIVTEAGATRPTASH
jgi:hypothetical protein